MKLIRAFPDNTKSDVEFFINPEKITKVMIANIKPTDQFQLWLCINDDSFYVETFDSKDDALDFLSELLKE